MTRGLGYCSGLWAWLCVIGAAPGQQVALPEPSPPTSAESGPRPDVTPRKVVVVHPLAYMELADGSFRGLCIPAKLEIGGAPAGRVRIGVYEPEVGGTTDVWRATTWSAALVAAQLTNFDPRAMQMSVEVPISTDGPSAGALLTIALIAAIRGDELRPDVTLTGTINPDGIIGPVGGIPMKIEGAAQAGQTVVLIPDDEPFEVDPRTGQRVNLIQLGKRLGVTVKPVGNIWAAYRELTGVELPRAPLGELPKSSTALDSVLREKMDRWIKMTVSAREKYYRLPEYARSGTELLIDQSNDMFLQAQGLSQQGDLLAAYVEYVKVAAWTWGAHEVTRYSYLLQNEGVESMMELPFSIDWLNQEMARTTTAIRDFRPQTLDQLALYLSACSLYFEALCAYELAEDLKGLEDSSLLQRDEFEGAAGGFSLFAGIYQMAAWVTFKQSIDLLDMAKASGGPPLPEHVDFVNVRHFYLRGAEVNLRLLEEICIDPLFRDDQIAEDLGRKMMFVADALYGTANIGLRRVLPGLEARLGQGTQLEYVSLAAAMSLHSRTAALFAKYYSIGVDTDSSFKIVRVHREQKFEEWLQASREECERSIIQLHSMGLDPTNCLQAYRLSRIAEKQTADDKFRALEGYFATNMLAGLLMKVGGNIEIPSIEPPAVVVPTSTGSLKLGTDDGETAANRDAGNRQSSKDNARPEPPRVRGR